jgi:hypothetical protein
MRNVVLAIAISIGMEYAASAQQKPTAQLGCDNCMEMQCHKVIADFKYEDKSLVPNLYADILIDSPGEVGLATLQLTSLEPREPGSFQVCIGGARAKIAVTRMIFRTMGNPASVWYQKFAKLRRPVTTITKVVRRIP